MLQFPFEQIEYIEQVCQKKDHYKQANQRPLQLYFISPLAWQNTKSQYFICEYCIKKEDDKCCKIKDFLNPLNEILKRYHWNQIYLNTKSVNCISKMLNKIIFNEQFLFDGQPITDLELFNDYSQILYYNMHISLNHDNKEKILQLFKQLFQILKVKVKELFFDIFNQPQLEIEFPEKYKLFTFIREKNILIGHNQLGNNVIIYNYKNKTQITLNVMFGKLCYNDNFLVYQHQNKDNFLNIVELSSLQQKVLIQVKFVINEMKIINNQLWIKYINQVGCFVSNLNFNELNSNDFQQIIRTKVNLFYSKVIVENNFIYYPEFYIKQFVNIRNNKTIYALKYPIQNLIQYDQQNKLIIFETENLNITKAYIFGFACKKIIRAFKITSGWSQIYKNRYLAYFRECEDELIFVDIFSAEQICHLKILKWQIRENNNSYFHFVNREVNYFWFH